MQFKVPEALMMAHGETLRAHDWTRPFMLADAFPAMGFEPWDQLEVIRPGVVASARMGTMIRIRRAADSLAVQPEPLSAAEIARVLQMRNPAVEQDHAILPEGNGDVA